MNCQDCLRDYRRRGLDPRQPFYLSHGRYAPAYCDAYCLGYREEKKVTPGVCNQIIYREISTFKAPDKARAAAKVRQAREGKPIVEGIEL